MHLPPTQRPLEASKFLNMASQSPTPQSMPPPEGTPSALFDLRTVPGYTSLLSAAPIRSARSAKRAGSPAPAKKGAAAQPLPPAPGAATGAPGRGTSHEDKGDWAKTDEDVVAYFELYGASAQTQYFFCLPGDEAAGSCSSDAAGTEFFLRVVPPESIAHTAPLVYYIVSPREVVRVEAPPQGKKQTETLPLAQWLAHKNAFLSIRRLTFFSCFSLAKRFTRWRTNVCGVVLARRQAQLRAGLMTVSPAFGEALQAVQGVLEQRLRAVRATMVQPGRRYTAEEWAEQQAAWRARKAQPEMDEAVAALVRVADEAVQRAEREAAELERTVLPSELTDRIGVDLHAATTKARARSMQQIKRDKIDRAESYHRALANRASLPRFLRMLDLRLRSALADMAAASVAGAAGVLSAAAPDLLHAPAAGSSSGEAVGAADAPMATSRPDCGGTRRGRATAWGQGGSPAFFCSISLGEDSSPAYSPSEEQWLAAVEEEVLAASLQLAGSVSGLLTLPAFERYQAQLAEGSAGEQSSEPAEQPGALSLGEAELALNGVFTAATAELRALLAASFERARELGRQYERYAEIRQFGTDFEFEAWAAQQRESLDLSAFGALLSRLRGWQEQVQGMPLAGAAGLLHLDASDLQAQLMPIVSSAQERVTGLLLQLAGERCREVLQEITVWREVAGGRPPELDGYLPWSAELAAMEAGLEERMQAAAAADAALEVVCTYAGRLPTADAVKRDDLQEAAQALPAELAAAGAWREEQRAGHAAAVEQQAALLVEEAILLESEAQVGQFVDPGSALEEVLSDLEMLAARAAQLTAQAEELAGVQAALAGAAGEFREVQEAEAAVKRCAERWHLVAEAEALRAQLAPVDDAGQEPAASDVGVEPAAKAQPQAEPAGSALAALQERLEALRGAASSPPDAIWIRASSAVHACLAALG